MKNNQEFEIVAKTSFGLEDVLVNELRELGANDITRGTRVVIFQGNKEMLYKANICLRTANRILMPIKKFSINNADDLYEKVKKIEWEDIFDIDQTFAIDSTVFSEIFNHTQFAAFKTKDAIADRFREKFDKRPDVDVKEPNIRINLHINNENECTISLDSSGIPLYKRGYRDSRSVAPIKEDLAAGMILLSGWDKKSNFIDLFCGSGTLLIEAALIAHNIAPNLEREVFGFSNWKNFDKDLLNDLKEDAFDAEIEFKHDIYGIDMDGRVLGMCRANLKKAGFLSTVKLFKKDFKDFDPPEDEKGIIISNPPYGERIDGDVDKLYEEFGDNLKEKYDGYNAWFISSNEEALKKVGLRPSRKIKLYNGSLECRFMKYEMYKGTKKIHKLQD